MSTIPYEKMLVAIFVGMMIAATFSVASVKANPITIMVSPTSGPPRTIMTVSGEDATPGGEIRVYVSMWFTSFFVAITNANSTGEYAADVTVPAFPEDVYSIVAIDPTSGETSSTTFTIMPMTSLSLEEGSFYDNVTVEGHGFHSFSHITLEFDGIDVTPALPIETDNFGSFEAQFTVPKVPQGTYNVTASDGSNEASAQFMVMPKITLSSSSGPVSTPLFVNGTGFAPSVPVSVEFNDINVTMIPTPFADADGGFMQFFLVPSSPDGTYTVEANDTVGNSATAPFTIPSPKLTLTPSKTSGPAIVTAKGSGFPQHAPVLLYLEDIFSVNFVDLMIENQAIFADEYGSYEYSFVVPVAAPGTYRVSVYSVGEGGLMMGEELASTTLTIVEDALLTEIQDDIATIIIPNLGTIKASLAEINATLVSIEGDIVTINTTIGMIKADVNDIQLKVTNINGDVATVETTLGTIQGRITSIEDGTATIQTDIGTVKADISDFTDTQGTFTIPLYTTVALALITAIGAIILLIMHAQAMRKPPKA